MDVVTPTDVSLGGTPQSRRRRESDVVGAVAMAAAAQTLMADGMEGVARHEDVLAAYALEHLQSVPGITLYGGGAPVDDNDRVGVLAFNLSSAPHALVAAILGYEGGIGVRSGCFCAQQYVSLLLGLEPSERAARLCAW